MKNKIKEALKQGHKKLGVSDEVFERVAASVETFITDESQIDGFVQSENTLNLLKSYQSMADKVRDYERFNKPQPNNTPPPPSDPGNQSQTQNQQAAAQPDLATAIAAAVAAQMKEVVTPLQEKLTLFEAEKAIESTIADVNARIDAWGYSKGYPKEMEKARSHAMELYEAYGKKWNADELEAKIKEKFNMEVHDKGLDTTQPFKGDSGGGESKFDADAWTQTMKEMGWDVPESK